MTELSVRELGNVKIALYEKSLHHVRAYAVSPGDAIFLTDGETSAEGPLSAIQAAIADVRDRCVGSLWETCRRASLIQVWQEAERRRRDSPL